MLDAKYKRHESLYDGAQREDRFQLLAYMHVFNVDVSGLIVPVSHVEDNNVHGKLSGRGGDMYLLGLDVEYYTDKYQDYCGYMNQQEIIISNQIKNIIN